MSINAYVVQFGFGVGVGGGFIYMHTLEKSIPELKVALSNV